MKKIYTLVLFTVLSFATFSQGDTPCTATALSQYAFGTPCLSTTYSTVGATNSGIADPLCADYQGGDVWFTAIIDANGILEVIGERVSGSFTDGGMAIYTGTCGSLSLYACDDDGNTAPSGSMPLISINDPGLSGQTVFIRFWEFGNDQSGDFDLCANYCAASNDLCAGAPLISTAVSISGDNYCGSTNGDDPAPVQISAGSLENTVWYEFTVPVSGNYDVTFSNTTCLMGSDLQAGVLTGTCGGPYTSVGDNTGSNFSINFNAAIATSYFLVVDGNAGALCSYDFIIEETCPITNDDCASAFDLITNTGSDAQQCYNAICNNGADDDITFAGACGDPNGAVLWYQITTDAGDGLIDIEVNSADFIPHIQTFDDCTGGANTFDYCNVTSGATATLTSIPVSGSTTYYFTVSPAAGVGQGEFDICVTSYPNTCTPSDDCPGTGPTVFGPLSSTVQSCLNNECNVGSTNPFTPEPTLCGTVQGGLTWYEFTTVNLLNDIVVTSADISDPMIQIWSDCSTLLTNSCAAGAAGTASLLGYQPAGGTGSTILFTVSSSSGAQTGDFDVCIESYPNTDACNVDDALAITGSVPVADVNGNYLPGTTVTFCYDILEYRHTAFNFLHGVVIDPAQLGSGWDLTTLVPVTTPAPQGPNEVCSQWDFFPANTVQYGTPGGKYPVGTNLGAGWWFQSTNSAGGPWDCTNIGGLNPNNSWGDGCTSNITVTAANNGDCNASGGNWLGGVVDNCELTGNCFTDPVAGFGFQWTFCFEITTKSSYDCSSPETFTMAMETFSDGETGAYTDLGCFVDIPEVMFNSAPSPAPIIFAVTTTDITCFGEDDGIIETVATGGYETLQYQIDDGSGYGPFQATGTFTGLTPGVYSVQAQDDILCIAALSNITITEPVIPSGPPAAYNEPICEGSNLELAAFTGAYSNYSWSGPNTFNSTLQNPTIVGASSGIHDGTYTVTADIGGCPSGRALLTVTINPIPTLTTTITASTCNGGTDGSATAIPLGGTTPYIYIWDISASSQSTGTASGLSFGNYAVSVTDAYGCSITDVATITEPGIVTATASQTTPATCIGISDGTATASGAGGNGAPFTYLWSNGDGAATASNLSSGITYSVTVTDVSGVCNDITTVTIAEPATSVTASIVLSTSVTCNGGSNGTATASGAGGNGAPFTYLWSNGDGAATASNLSSGITYSVTVTDVSGVCNDITTVTIAEPATSLTASIVSSTSVTCNGGSNGTATASGAGGNGAPFTYLWSNGVGAATASNLSSGITYSVTVTDVSGVCNDITTITIAEPATSLTASIVSSTSVTCNGGSDGTATASGSGGNGAPFTYLWSNGDGAATASNLSSGITYSVTVEDQFGVCNDITTITVIDATAITVSFGATNPSSCAGGTDGQSTALAAGGASGYSYQWDALAGSQTVAAATGLAPGNYTVTVTDGSTCIGTGTVTITNNNTPPTANIAAPAVLNCTNTTITLDASSSVGIGTLDYNWSTAGGNILSGGTTDSPNIDGQGTYTVIITDGANGCTDTEIVTVTQNVIIPTTTITACNGTSSAGASDGDVAVSVGTAPGPYVYSWSPAPAAGQGNVSIVNSLPTGTYSVLVTASNGCTVTDGCTVNDPACQVTVSITTVTDVSCNGGNSGTATITMIGGSGTSFTYNWPNGQTTAFVTGLSQGSFVGSVTDNNGCFSTATANISEPTVLAAIATLNSNALCNGNSNGVITASAIGGTTPYNYLWSTSATSASLSGLPIGIYTVTVSDGASSPGCTDIANVTVSEPNPMAITLTCNPTSIAGGTDGSSSTAVSGGDGNYTYSWTGGETTSSITGLTAGIQNVTVSDGNLCSITDNCNVIDPGCAVVGTTTITDVTCNGGADGFIVAEGSGGVSPYSFVWSDAQSGTSATGLSTGNITVTVTDAALCTDIITVSVSEPSLIITNIVCSPATTSGGSEGSSATAPTGGNSSYTYLWSNSATTASISGIPQGAYTVTVTDGSLCAVTSTCNVVDPSCALTLTPSFTDVLCFGLNTGVASVVASGGVLPYSYAWTVAGTDASVSALTAGVYTVTATDAALCPIIEVITISEPASALSVSATIISDETCGAVDGEATIVPSGGTGTYAYNWPDGSTTANLTGLSSGGYNVTVTDFNNCTSVEIVNIGSIGGPSVTVTPVDAQCNGMSNGSISTNAAGGLPVYLYLWSTLETTPSITGLFQGSYSVTVTNNNGTCPFSSTVTVNEPSALTVTMVGNSVSCNGLADGVVTANVSGGNLPYSFDWTLAGTTNSISGLSANTYSVTVTDGDICTAIQPITITEPSSLSVTAVSANTSCNSSTDGTATVTAVGGTSGYTYIWGSGSTTQQITGIAGSYNVTVSDANLCSSITVTSISEPLGITLTTLSTSVTCNGESDGDATVVAVGGNSGYSYLWTDNQTTSFSTGLSAGIQSVTVVDNLGCTQAQIVTISEPSSITVSYSTIDAACGNSNGSATLNPSGGMSGYTYIWSNSETSQTVTGLDANSYLATVTDINLCVSTVTFAINNPNPSTTVTAITTITCNSLSEGNATVQVSGGTSPYSYSWVAFPSLIPISSANAVTGLAAGVYKVSVQDATPAPNGPCQIVHVITVTEPAILSVSISENQSIGCFGDSDGIISANASGGTTQYSYIWTSGLTTSTVSGLTTGNYEITATDHNGCIAIDSYNLTQPVQVISADTVTFCSTADNLVTIAGSPVSGTWASPPNVSLTSNGVLDVDATPWTVGAPYQITLTDPASGCFSVTELIINGAIAGGDLFECEANSIVTLNVAQPINGIWSGNNIIDPINGGVDISGLSGINQYIYTSNGCPDTLNLIIIPIPSAPQLSNISICGEDSILFIVDPQGGIVEWYSDSMLTPASLISNDTAFSPNIIQFDTTQTYYAVFLNNNCYSDTIPVNAVIGDSMVVSFTASPNNGTSPLFVEFTNTSVGVDTLFDYFEWSFGDGDNSNEFETENTYSSVGEFTAQLVVTDYYNGCSDSSEVTIITDGTTSLVVPVVFSPDGDGINDRFYVMQNNLLTLDVEVYNRWGENLYQWEGINGDWDGRTFAGEQAPSGTYFIIITATGIDEAGNEYTYGPQATAVTLVRGN